MSDDVLSVIPTDPYWQPDAAAAERALALVAELIGEDDDAELEVSRHDRPAAVDCGENLVSIGCPHCGGPVDPQWWRDLLEAHAEDGFATLAATVPCCGAATTLDALDYDRPCGFARFEIEVWNPSCRWFTEAQLAAVAAELGHPVRQIRAHL
ncbi:hypothetical protein VM98_08590 [Streptomyces rubellomurinus subsp. indigoferus]|nr:hypothetical protein VM98_08590 [Streptomyces rubellomurinus subsp. indigoferus]